MSARDWARERPWTLCGAAALAVGGNLVSNKQVLAQDFAGITANARAFADAVNAARGEQ